MNNFPTNYSEADEFVPSADFFNRAGALLNQMEIMPDGAAETVPGNFGIVEAVNAGAADIAALRPVVLKNVWKREGNGYKMYYAAELAPDGETAIGITLEKLAANKENAGGVALAGIALAKVSVSSTEHQFAKVSGGLLVSASSGPFRLVGKAEETGTKYMEILLSSASSGPVWCKTSAAGNPATGISAVAYPDGPNGSPGDACTVYAPECAVTASLPADSWLFALPVSIQISGGND